MKTGYEQCVHKTLGGWQWLGAEGERGVCKTKRDALAEAERSRTGIHQSLMRTHTEAKRGIPCARCNV
jgi:hypothetical protein